MSYEEPKENEWVRPVARNYRMACCDCGLVHRADFRVRDGRVEFRMRRDNRATAGMRVSMAMRKDPQTGDWYYPEDGGKK